MQRTAFSHEVSQSELNYLRSQGLNNQEIAKRVGCAPCTVSRYLPSQRKARVKLNEKDHKDILELYQDGNSVKEIADTYNCSIGVIYRVLDANGVVRQKKAKQEHEEEPEQDTPDQPQDHSGRMTVYQMGLYDGWKGVYKVNLTEHKVEFPELPKMMEKQELGFYIRDLMQIWKEM